MSINPYETSATETRVADRPPRITPKRLVIVHAVTLALMLTFVGGAFLVLGDMSLAKAVRQYGQLAWAIVYVVGALVLGNMLVWLATLVAFIFWFLKHHRTNRNVFRQQFGWIFAEVFLVAIQVSLLYLSTER